MLLIIVLVFNHSFIVMNAYPESLTPTNVACKQYARERKIENTMKQKKDTML